MLETEDVRVDRGASIMLGNFGDSFSLSAEASGYSRNFRAVTPLFDERVLICSLSCPDSGMYKVTMLGF